MAKTKAKPVEREEGIATSTIPVHSNGLEKLRITIERGEAFLAANPEKIDRYDIARWLNEAQAVVGRFCPTRSTEFSTADPSGPWGGESPYDCLRVRLAILRHEASVFEHAAT